MSGRLTSFLGVLFIVCSCRSTASPPTEVKPRLESPASSASAVQGPSPTPSSVASTPLPGPCILLEPRARTDRDWRREATPYFEADFMGLLFRIDRPGEELDAVHRVRAASTRSLPLAEPEEARMPTLKDLLLTPLLATPPANENSNPTDVRLPPEPSVRNRDASDLQRPKPPPRQRGGQRGAIQHRALRPRRRT